MSGPGQALLILLLVLKSGLNRTDLLLRDEAGAATVAGVVGEVVGEGFSLVSDGVTCNTI